MCTTNEKKVFQHLWQDQNLGVAPFRAITIISIPSKGLAEQNLDAYNNAMREACEIARGFGVELCSCYSCGMSLMNNVVIRDANGKHFVVGLDCAQKTGDSKLMTEAEALERKRQRALRAKRAEEQRRIAFEARQVELQAQRDRNGGLTDHELATQQRNNAEQAARQARREEAIESNAWLVKVLTVVAQSSNSGFVRDMIERLAEYRFSTEYFSERQRQVLCDIYAKAHGRRNSKAYDEAYEFAEARIYWPN